MTDQPQDQALPTAQEPIDGSSSDDEVHTDREEETSDDDGDKYEVLLEPCTFESQIYDRQKTVEPVLSKLPAEDQKAQIAKLMSNQKDGLNAPRGIQSLYNSSSSDCTLFAMFAYNTTFDFLFDPSFGLPCEANSPLRILSRQIVTPLRKIGFVGAKRVVALKLAIQRVGNLRTRTVVDVRKPDRFLDDVLKYGLRLDYQLKLHSKDPKQPPTVTKANSITVDVEYKEDQEFVTSSALIEKWTLKAMKKLEAPMKNLIVNLNRKSGTFDEPTVILPLITVSLAHCLHNVKRICIQCLANKEALATMECPDCFGADPKHMNLSECTYCDLCFQKEHQPDSEKAGHHAIPISQQNLPANQVAKGGTSLHDNTGLSYPYELYAVICQNVTGYVVYACTDIDIESIKEVISDYLAPLENPNTEEQPQASSTEDGTTKPKNPAGVPPTQETPGSSMGSEDQNNEKKDTRLWVYYDPEAVVKEDVRGGFNVPQVYAVEDFQTLINHNTLDKTHGLVDAFGETVNTQHQYRILCESVALFYRPLQSDKGNH